MNNKVRLDQVMVDRRLVATRSQASSWIRLGKVFVGGIQVTRPGMTVGSEDRIELKATEQYVSRAGLKLASAAESLKLDFRKKVVLDVGSSTGGFTDYALRHGARKVIAVDVGTNQMHPDLRIDPRVELHEQTDIRDVSELSYLPELVVVDVSFISLRQVLPSIARLCTKSTEIVAMCKPQFETTKTALKHGGVIKNERMRRDILQEFENWAREHFVIIDKADSAVAGSRGNQERFYILHKK